MNHSEILSSGKVYDDFSDEWNWYAIYKENGDIFVYARKFASFSHVSFEIRDNENWYCNLLVKLNGLIN